MARPKMITKSFCQQFVVEGYHPMRSLTTLKKKTFENIAGKGEL